MSVLFDASVFDGWKIVVDNVHHVADVDTAGSHTGSNENGRFARAERAHGGFTLQLSPLAVHRSNGKPHVVQKIVEVVHFTTTVGKNNCSHSMHLVQETQESIALLFTFCLQNNLLDVLCCASGTTDSKADVMGRQVLFGKVTSRLGKGCREESVLDVALILLCKVR